MGDGFCENDFGERGYALRIFGGARGGDEASGANSKDGGGKGQRQESETSPPSRLEHWVPPAC